MGGEMTKIADQKTYVQLLNSVKARIRKAQYDALKAVNKELIDLYGDIGRMIVERQVARIRLETVKHQEKVR
jgi:hypothetical protein